MNFIRRIRQLFHPMEEGLLLTVVFLLLTAAALSVPAAVYISASAGEAMLPVYRVERSDQLLSLTFDAAWGNEDIREILAILEKHQIRATFFVTGDWASAYPEEIRVITAAGHDIGNHSATHPRMTELSEESMKRELLSVQETVRELTGQQMSLFRAPYGEYNNRLLQTAAACGYQTIQWSVDSEDWREYGVEEIVEAVTKSRDLGSGAIILMHSGAKYTRDALEAVILTLEEAGYQFVPVSELIYTDHFRIDASGKQIPDSDSL